ncbi:MAG: stage II sporulation protein D [Clostridiaceae bacterium]|nr:stage II sporulation protein D [Clostridiaceae bacterium]
MSKIVSIFMGGILFLFLLSILIVGIGHNDIEKDINIDKIDKFIIKPNNISFDSNNGGGPIIKVYISKDKKVVEMFLEEYVRGVVAGEMPAEFSLEALKAQAVAARTYALSHMSKYGNQKCNKGEGADICDTVHCQVYMSKDVRLNSWPSKTKGELWNKITEAVLGTEGQVLTYNDKLVLSPYYFSTSSGRTESAIDIFNVDVPYLKGVQSKGEEISPSFKSTKKITYSELVKKLNASYPKAGLTTSKVKNQIKILSSYEGGSVNNIKIGNLTISGVKFRNVLGLGSDNFTLGFDSKNISIVCKGYGHSVGMSQWGANVMGNSGKLYKDILTHYYDGVKVEVMKY